MRKKVFQARSGLEKEWERETERGFNATAVWVDVGEKSKHMSENLAAFSFDREHLFVYPARDSVAA